MKDKTKFEVKFIVMACFILAIMCIVVAIVNPGQQKIVEQPCEIIQSESILEQVDKRVCEINDIQKNIIECFYGEFSVAREETYAKITYKEIGYEKIYFVIPGGGIKIYSLEDKE